MPGTAAERIAQLRAAIAAQESLRPILGDAVVDAALAALHQQLAALEREQGAPASQAERKLVTILFADLADSTHLAEQGEPDSPRRLL